MDVRNQWHAQRVLVIKPMNEWYWHIHYHTEERIV